jgi:hypothetical protein
VPEFSNVPEPYIIEFSIAPNTGNRSPNIGMVASEIYPLNRWTTLEERCSCLNT